MSDNAFYRASLVRIARSCVGGAEFREAACVYSAVEHCEQHSPDVVVLDLATNNGTACMNYLAGHRFRGPMLVLAETPVERAVIESCVARAACALRSGSVESLRVGLHRVVAEAHANSAGDGRRGGRTPGRGGPDVAVELGSVDSLTRAERRVAERLSLSNKAIARELGLSVATVKNHVHRILGKLGVGKRAQAYALVREQVLDLD